MEDRSWRDALPTSPGIISGDFEGLTATHAIDDARAHGGLARGDAKLRLTRSALEIERDRIDLSYMKRSCHMLWVPYPSMDLSRS
jgi:hypothetical protein